MFSNKSSYLKLIPLPFISLFFYWAVIWEMIIWKKPLVEALVSSSWNWGLLVVSIIAEIILLRRQTKFEFKTKDVFNQKETKTKDKIDDSNPWKKPNDKKRHGENKASFSYFAKDVFGSFGRRTSKEFGAFGRKKIHIRFLLKIKRVVFAGLFFLYLALAVASFSSIPFFILFLATAYLALDYLWKTRRFKWEPKNEK